MGRLWLCAAKNKAQRAAWDVLENYTTSVWVQPGLAISLEAPNFGVSPGHFD